MQNLSAKQSTPNLSDWLQPHPKLDGLAVIDHLFNRMDGMYPHRWRSAFGSPQAVANWREAWADGFAAEGINLDEIKHGIAACRRMFDWPPSLAEFIRACRPPIDPEAAFHEAVRQIIRRIDGKDAWPHPAVFWAAHQIGDFEMRKTTWPAIKSRWTAALTEQLGKREWLEIPLKREALPQPGRSTVTMEEGRRRMDDLHAVIERKKSGSPAVVAGQAE